jgi:hypothetical protein
VKNYFYSYHNTGHYPLSHLLFKMRFGDWILSLSPSETQSIHSHKPTEKIIHDSNKLLAYSHKVGLCSFLLVCLFPPPITAR